MRRRTAAEDGDVVVREEERAGLLVYVLSTASGPGQVLVRSREDAVAQAVTFAERQHVRVWLTALNSDFTLLEDFRALHARPDHRQSEAALDWHIAKTVRPNVLIIGAAGAIEQSLAALWPYLDTPVWCGTVDTLRQTAQSARTIVIREVGGLSASQQVELSLWLAESAAMRIHVVSTTSVPLFQMVTAGLFFDSLYYRLNTLVLDMQNHPVPVTTTLTRIRGEYLEMPGLRLTLEQAQRLCGVEATVCQSVFDALVDAKFLCLKSNGAYARVSD